MRIGYFSPLNPVKSGISDYSESLLVELSKLTEVDLFVDGYLPSSSWITENFRVIDCQRESVLTKLPQYDAVLYHMGGTPSHHKYVYDHMLQYPGILVLHDLMYQGFFGDLWLREGKYERYLREMGACYGREGIEIGRKIMAGEYIPYETLRGFPLNKRMINISRGVIVHSHLGANEVEQVNPRVFLEIINHHDFGWSNWDRYGYSPGDARREARKKLGIKSSSKVLASFGLIVTTKRIEVALRAFARANQDIPDSVFFLVGEPKYPILEYIRFLGLDGAVTVTGHVPISRFRTYLESADVCINLRYPSQGETSGAVLRMLALGKTVIVTDHGWFTELPDDACAKVEIDEFEEEILYEFMRGLMRNEDHRYQMGVNAHRYATRECALESIAKKYVEFMSRCCTEQRTSYV